MYRILSDEITLLDDCVLHNCLFGGRSGIVVGRYNQCNISVSGNNVIVDTGEIIIAGVRVAIDEPVNFPLLNTPSAAVDYHIIGEIVLLDGKFTFMLKLQIKSDLICEPIYKQNNGIYQSEVATFKHTSNGIEKLEKVLPIISGSPGEINIGKVKVNTLSPVGIPKVKITKDLDFATKKYLTNFTFDLPRLTDKENGSSAGVTLYNGEMYLDPANDAQWDCLSVVPSDFPETSGGDATVADVPHDKRTHKLIVLPHVDIKSSGYTTLEILFEWRQTVVQPADSYNPETSLEYRIPAVCRMRLNEELFGAMGIGGEAVRSMFGETITDADFAAGIACYQKMTVDNNFRENFYRRTNRIPIAPNIPNPYGETCTFGLSFGTLNGIKSKLKPETFKEFEKIIFGKLNSSVAPPEVCSFLLLNRTFIAPKLQQQPPYYEEEHFDSFWNDSFHNGHPDSKKTVHWSPLSITGAPDYETKVHGYNTFNSFGYKNGEVYQTCFDLDNSQGATIGRDEEWGLNCLKGLLWSAEFKASYPPFVIKKIRLV